MLDFLNENISLWTPEPLPEEKIEELYQSVRPNPGEEAEWLIIFRVDPYIDSLYVHYSFRSNEKPIKIKRFTFQEDYRWSYADENYFSQHCLNNLHLKYTFDALDKIYRHYDEKYPDWKLNRYYTKPIRLLDHIYNCMKKNTAKEMLYKAQLDNLASYIDDLDEINMLAKKPSELYDGLSIKILRALNCREGSILLSVKEKRDFLKKLQSAFPDIFKTPLNDAQCRYLRYLIDGDLTYGEAGRLFNSRRMDLMMIWNDSQYEIFMVKEKDQESARKAQTQLGKIDPIYEKYLPDVRNNLLWEMSDSIWELENYLLIEREEYDKKIRRSNRKREYDWQERKYGYVVRYPQTINDFCREAVYMSNCLLTFVEAFIKNDTTILFMRRPEDVNTPFITMEIYQGELMQAYHRFNDDCTEEEAEWIREYCKRHSIGTNKFHFNAEIDVLF